MNVGDPKQFLSNFLVLLSAIRVPKYDYKNHLISIEIDFIYYHYISKIFGKGYAVNIQFGKHLSNDPIYCFILAVFVRLIYNTSGQFFQPFTVL